MKDIGLVIGQWEESLMVTGESPLVEHCGRPARTGCASALRLQSKRGYMTALAEPSIHGDQGQVVDERRRHNDGVVNVEDLELVKTNTFAPAITCP